MNAPFSIAQATGPVVATDFSAQSKPPRVIKVAKPQSNQAVSIHLDGNTKLDLSDIAGDKITFVRVGERLVILFDNQATVTIDPIFASDGSTSADVSFLVDSNRLMTGTEFAAAFPIGTDQSILPAAGDGGGGGPVAGAHFVDPSVDPLGPVGINALLGPEDLAGPGFGPRDAGINGAVIIGGADAAVLDEEGLPGGNAGGPGDVNGEATSFTGSLHVNFGPDVAGRSFTFTANQPGLGGLTSGGEVVHIAIGTIGGEPALFGYIGNDPTLASARVFVVTLDNGPIDGAYTVTILKPLDHSAAGTEDDLTLSIGFTATNGLGNSASSTISITINDDSPTAATIADDTVTEQTAVPGGEFVTQSTGAVSLNISWGADNANTNTGAIDRKVAFLTTDAPTGLTSNGEAITYSLNADGTLLTASAGARAVFTVQLSDTGNGSYTFTLLDNLDHATGNGTNDLALSFAVRATDADGDPVDTAFAVHVTDSVPTAAAIGDETLSESTQNGESNTFVTATLSNVSLHIDWKSDDANAGGTNDRKVAFDASLDGSQPAGLTSDGHQITYHLSNNGTLLTATTGEGEGAHTVFTVQLSDTGNGTYTFTLLDNLDHVASGQSQGEGEGPGRDTTIPLNFGFTATDSDGDPVTSNFTVDVTDDAPTAGEIATQSIGEATSGEGNTFVTAVLSNISLNIDWNSDDANAGGTIDRKVAFDASLDGSQPTGLTSNGLQVTYHLSNDGTLLTATAGEGEGAHTVFTVQLSDTDNGHYTFTLLDNLDHIAQIPSESEGEGEGEGPTTVLTSEISLTFAFTATDADHDHADSSFTVSIQDDVPVVPSAATILASVNENDLPNGNDEAAPKESLSTSAALGVKWGADDDLTTGPADPIGRKLSFGTLPSGLTSDGIAIVYGTVVDLNDGGQQVVAYKGSAVAGNEVFTVTLDPTTGTGTATFLLQGNLDHPAGQGTTAETLTFTFQATDADGDTATQTGTFTVDVVDDVPTLGTPDVVKVDEEGLGGNAGDTYASGDLAGTATSGTGNLNIHWGADDADNSGPGNPINRNVVFSASGGGAFVQNGVAKAYSAYVDANDGAGNGTITLTSDGQTVHLWASADGRTLYGYVGNAPSGNNAPSMSSRVFTIVLHDDGGTGDGGTYSFTLQRNLDHPQGGNEDDLQLTFNFKATDGDADPVSGAFSVLVNDDAPIFTSAPQTGTVDEEHVPGLYGNPGGPGDVSGADDDVTGNLHISWGADDRDNAGAPDRDVVFNGITQNGTLTVQSDSGPITLTSDGQTVHLWISADGHTLYGYVGNAPSGNNAPSTSSRVFTVTVNDDNSGSYTFTLHDNLDHPHANVEDNLTLTFGIKATDSDGDSITNSFSVVVNDDTPVISCTDNQSVNEDDLPTGNDSFKESLTRVGDLGISWGADSNDTGTTNNRSVAFAASTLTALNNLHLTSNNVELSYALNSDSTLLTAYRVNASGHYISGTGQDLGTTANDAARVFTVSLDDDNSGSYSFTLRDNIDHQSGHGENETDLKFTFIATDSDGDTATANFSVSVIDDVPVIGHPDSNKSVNEDDLSDGNDTSKESLSTTGNLDISWGADDNNNSANAPHDRTVAFSGITNGATVTFDPPGPDSSDPLKSHGSLVKFVVVSSTLVIGVADDGAGVGADGTGHVTSGREVFRITLSDAGSGSYTFTLTDQIDHPDGSGENSINLKFGFTATDSDGDSTTDDFTVAIVDDIPTQPTIAITSSLVYDETLGVQNTASDSEATNDTDVENDVGNATGAAAFSGVTGLSALTALGYGQTTVVSVTPHYGADGAGTTHLSLTESDGDAFSGRATNLFDTATGNRIFLYTDSSGVVLGRVGNDSGTGSNSDNSNGAISFALKIGDDGSLTIAEYRAIKHPVADSGDGIHDSDDVVSLLSSNGSGLVYVTAKSTDFDGDSATRTSSAALTIKIDDDGPRFTSGPSAPTLILDGSLAGGAGDFPHPGNWSPNAAFDDDGSIAGWQYSAAPVNGATTVQLQRVDSGYHGVTSSNGNPLVDLEASPGNIQISQTVHGLTLGQELVVSFEIGQADFGNAKLEVLWNGVSVGTFDPVAGVAAQLKSVAVTALAGDNTLTFREIGTSGDNTGTFLTNVAVRNAVIIDETPGVDANSNDTIDPAVAALFTGHVVNPGSDPDMGSPQYARGAVSLVSFTADYGVDGPGVKPVIYGLTISASGVDSGLTTTDNKPIKLFLEDNGHLIVGRYETDGVAGITTADKAAFALSIDPVTGQVSIAQYVSLHHPDTGSNDEGVYLATGTVSVSVTLTDGDLDTATQSFDVSSNIRFEDDGPKVNASQTTLTVDEDGLAIGNQNDPYPGDASATAATVNGTLVYGFGADGASGASNDIQFDTTSLSAAGLKSGGVALVYGWDDTTNTLTATAGLNGPTVFTLHVTNVLTGAYTFTLAQALDHNTTTGANTEDDINIDFAFTVRDGDGDPASGTVRIVVDDDAPRIDTPPVGANLIVNGQFSDDAGFGPDLGWGGHSASGSIQGWTISGADLERNPANWYVPDPADGGRVVDLDATPGDVTLTQTFTTLANGQSYVLSFDAAKPAGYDAKTEVYWNGVLVGTITPQSAAFQQFSLTVTATGSDTLKFVEVGAPDNGGTFLANVALHNASTFVDEDALGGNAGGQGDGPGTATATGALGIHWGADIGDVADAGGVQDGTSANALSDDIAALTGRAVYFTDANPATSALDPSIVAKIGSTAITLQSAGQDVHYQVLENGTKIVGYTGAFSAADHSNWVFQVSLSDESNGGYTFTLLKALDHPMAGSEDDITLTFGYTARDFDGDTAASTLTITVDDDTPVTGTAEIKTVIESTANTVNSNAFIAPPAAVGSLAISWGADNANPTAGAGAHDRSVQFAASLDNYASGLTSNGWAITYTLSADHMTLTATASSGGQHPSFRTVFTVSLDDNTGNYTFNLLDNLDHPAPDVPGAIKNDLPLSFAFIATDSDGDSTAGSFTVKVTDDIPVRTGAAEDITVSEAGLTSAPLVATSGALHIDWNADDKNVHLEFATQVIKDANGNALTLKSDGVELVYVVRPADGGFGPDQELVAYKLGDPQTLGNEVFIVSLNGAGNNPVYVFTQFQNIDHPGAGTDTLSLHFTVTAFDGDQDSVQQTFTINVVDDVPTATNATVDLTEVFEDGLPTGNPEGAPGSQPTTATISFSDLSTLVHAGADAPVTFGFNALKDGAASGLTSGGSAITYHIVGDTLSGVTADNRTIFTLVDQHDGSFKFTLLGSVDHGALNSGTGDAETLTFNLAALFTATDGDNDSVVLAGALNIKIENDIPIVTTQGNLIVNGSFELGHDDLGNGQWSIYHSIPGWTTKDIGAEGPAGDVPFEIQVGAPGGLAAQEGSALIELDSDGSSGNLSGGDHFNDSGHTNATIEQVVAGTIAGQSYALTFWYSPRANEGNADSGNMNVLWNGTLVQAVSSVGMVAGQWQQFTVMVTGTGAGDTVAFQGAGQENSLGAFLDNVSLVPAVAVDEDGLPHGNHDSQLGDIVVPNEAVNPDNNEATATGQLNIKWGADDVNGGTDTHVAGDSAAGFVQDASGRSVTFTDTTVAVAGGTLTSHGDVIVLTLSADRTVLTGTATHGTDAARVVFEVSLSDDGTGAFRFILKDALDQTAGQAENTLGLTFNFTATDSDGDSATGSFQVLVNDDVPTLASAVTVGDEVDEDALTGASTGNVDASRSGETAGPVPSSATASGNAGSLNALVNFGADGPGSTFGLVSQANAKAWIAGLQLQSHGSPIDDATISGNTLTAKAHDGHSVFSLTVNLDGSWAFKLLDQLDHPQTNNPATLATEVTFEDTLAVNLAGLVVATDADGDQLPLTNANFQVVVRDDVPYFDTIAPVTDTQVGSLVQGTFGFHVGADEPGQLSVTAPTIAGVDVATITDINTGVVTITGTFSGSGETYYVLTVNPNGTYTFQIENLPSGTAPLGSVDVAHSFAPIQVKDFGAFKFVADAGHSINGSAQGAGVDDDNLEAGDHLTVQFDNQMTVASFGVNHSGGSGVILQWKAYSSTDPTHFETGSALINADGTFTVDIAAHIDATTNISSFDTLEILGVAEGNGSGKVKVNTVSGTQIAESTAPTSFDFGLTGSDFDHDIATATIHINYAQNGTPTVSSDLAGLSDVDGDNHVAGSNADAFVAQSATGSLNIGYGLDGAGSPKFAAVYDGTLGTQVSNSSSAGVTTITTAYWTLTINETSGAYTFTQTAAYPHDIGASSDTGHVTVTVKDASGDTAIGTLTLTIADDVPHAANDTASVNTGAVNGSVLTNDDLGADHGLVGTDGHVTDITNSSAAHQSIAANGVATISGQYGSLEIHADGSYTYTRAATAVDAASDTFTYTVTDADGDKSSATLTISLAQQNLLVVGSAQDDTSAQSALHTVPSPIADHGVVQGQGGDDILVGDPGGATAAVAGKVANFVLVLDTSGSVDGSQFTLLQNSVNGLLNSLSGSHAQDVRVHIVTFNDTATDLGTFDLISGGVVNSAALTQALNAINSLDSSNGTNYEAGLQEALAYIQGSTTTLTINDRSDGFDANSSNASGNNDTAYILSHGSTQIALVSAWDSPGTTTANLVDADGNIGSGFGVDDDEVDPGEVLRFDFGSFNDFDGAGTYYNGEGFNGVPVTSATFTLDDNASGSTGFSYTIHFVGGTTQSGSASVNGAADVTLAGTGGNLGKLIDYIDFSVTSGHGDVDLVSVVSTVAPGTLPNADVNQLVFLSDGEPNEAMDNDGDPTSVTAAEAIQHILGTYNPSGTSNDDNVSEVGAIESNTAGPLDQTFTIQAFGLNTTSSDLNLLGQVEGTGGVATNLTGSGDLAAAYAGVIAGIGSTPASVAAAGSDFINGGNGNDVIYGDVLFTDILSANTGAGLPAGSGWAVFAKLESGQVAGHTAWTRADTLAYIQGHQAELAGESGRSGGNDVINAGAGNDVVYGQEGNDLITGGAGDDVLHGGSGNDAFFYRTGDGNDIVDGGAGSDTFTITNTGGAQTFNIGTITGGAEIVPVTGTNATDIQVSMGAASIRMDEIEDIVINLGAGGDTVNVLTSLNGTALDVSTIHVTGGAGDDTIDLTGRGAGDIHRVVVDGGANDPAGDTVKLDFAYADITGVTAVTGGFQITHNGITDVFTNIENFQFKDTTQTYAQLLAAPTAPSISSVIDNVSPNTGTLASGASTNDPTLDVKVSLGSTGALAGDHVQLFNGTSTLGGAVTLSATDIANGFVTITTPSLTNGTYNLNATISDLFNNTSAASAGFTVTEDTIAPARPAITGFDTDSGPAGDHITNDTTLTIKGNAEANSTVVLYQDGVQVGTVTVDSSRTWSITDPNTLQNGTTYQFTAVATDAAGNVSATSTSYAVSVDTTADADANLAVVINDGDGFINNSEKSAVSYTINGLDSDATATVTFTSSGGGSPIVVTGLSGGAHNVNLSALGDGTITATVSAVDTATNTATGASDTSVKDTVAPTAPTIGLVASDDVINAAEQAATVTVTGTKEAGSTVTLNGNATIEVDATHWSYTLSSSAIAGFGQGGETLTAVASDAAGNTSTGTRGISVDTIAPAAGTLAFLNLSDSGASSTPPVTTDNSFNLDLSGEGTGTVAYQKSTDGGATWTGTTTTQNSIADGDYLFRATVTDTAGNTSTSNTIEVIIDHVAPGAPTALDLSASDDTGASNSDNITKNTSGLTITGNAEAGATVTLFDDANNNGAVNSGESLGTATVASDGTFSLNVALGEGTHNIRAIQTDLAGNVSGASTTHALDVTVDVTAPGKPTSLGLSASDDSGSSNSDDITKNTSGLTITGNGETGATVTLFDDIDNDGVIDAGESLGTTTVAGGTFSLDVALAQGTHNIRAIQTDVAGNVSAASTAHGLDIVVDTTVAAPTLLDLSASDDSGTLNSDNITKNTSGLTINGSGETGATVTLFDDANNDGVVDAGESLGTTTVSAGTFSLDVALAQGTHNIRAIQTDLAGNVSAASASHALDITVDTTAAAPTLLDLNVSDDTGTSNSDNITKNTSGLTISGSGETGATVTLFDDIDNDGVVDAGESLGTTTVAGGTFSLDVALAQGTHNIRAVQTDVAGNTSVASATHALDITVDTTAAAPTLLDLNAADDSGTSSTDNITKNTSGLTISGSGETGATVTLFDDADNDGIVDAGESLGATAVSGGTFSLDIALGQGTHNIRAIQTDVAGNTSAASTAHALDIVVDTGAPGKPSITSVSDDFGSTTGAVTNGGNTDDTTPTLAGSAEANAIVTILDGATVLGTTAANGAGAWIYTPAALPPGAHSFTVTATDAAGNLSVASDAFAVTVVQNVAPVTQDITATGNEDTLIAVQLKGTDADGNLSGFRIKSLPATGTLYSDAAGTVLISDEQLLTGTSPLTVYFKPPANWSGTTSFDYTTRDAGGLEDVTPATATVDVAPVADAFSVALTANSSQPVPTGNEFRVNTTLTNDQSEASVASLTNGGFVVTWRSENANGTYNVYQQRYDANKTAVGSETLVGNGYAAQNYPTTPDVVGLKNGGYVVIYDKPYDGVYARIYDNSGTGGTEFKVNSGNSNIPADSSITALANGGFIVTWHMWTGSSSSQRYDVYAKVYDASGGTVVAQFKVNSGVNGDQLEPAITALSDGTFVATWTSAPSGGQYALIARHFSANGTAIGNDITVAANEGAGAGDQTTPSVVALQNGGFAVVWSGATNWDSDIRVQMYDSTNTKIGTTFVANTTTAGNQFVPNTIALSDGGFLVTWSSITADASSENIYGQRFNASGAKVGGEFLIGQTAVGFDTGHEGGNGIALLSSGELVTTWSSSPALNGDADVYARVIQIPNSILTVEDTAATVPLKVTLTDVDGSEHVTQIVLSGLPAGTTFNVGHVDSSDATHWIIDNPTATQLAALSMTPAHDYNGSFTITASVTVHDDATLSTGATFDTKTVLLDVPVTVTAVNDAPVISSGANATIPENTTAAYQITATDADADTLTYSVTGTDAALFNVSATGAVTFKTAPNFEAPADSGSNNKYDIIVHANDGTVDTAQAVQITVTNVNEAPVAGDPYAVGIGYIVTAPGGTTGSLYDTQSTTLPSTLFSDPEGVPLAWSASNLPTGFSFDSTTHVVSFPNSVATGIYDLTISASDGVSSTSQIVKVWVAGSTTTAVNGDGGSGNDTLIGGSSGATYHGNAGNDFIDGGAGGDTITGDDGNDVLYGSTNATAGSFDTINGGNNNDYINGGANDDKLFGDAGDDWVVGEDGSDQLTGGAGNDTLLGGNGNDQFFYTIGDGADRVFGGAGTDTLTITGTAVDDTLNVVVAGGVIAQFANGTVKDVEAVTLDLGAHGSAGDTLSYAGTASTESITVDLTNNVATGFTSIANVENVTGGDGNDTITGNSGANTLIGGDGDDILIGGKDDVVVQVVATGTNSSSNANYFHFDFLKGDPSSFVDTMTINLRAGTDADAIFDSSTGTARNGDGQWGPTISNTTGGANEFNILTDTPNDVGTLTINPLGQQFGLGMGFSLNVDIDRLGSSTATNSPNGDADRLASVGATVTVTLENGEGSGTATFQANGTGSSLATVKIAVDTADYLDGGAGNDTISGGGGNDILIGGTGKDTLTGGSGADRFTYNAPGEGGTSVATADHIVDFSIAEGDMIDLLGSAFGGFAAGNVSASLFSAKTDGTFENSTQRFAFDQTNHALIYDSNGSAAGGTQAVLAVLDNNVNITNAQLHFT